ncbi:MAG: chlorite dismutase family protein [Acidobacteria bacterium]|nr:chlorite dismutase family protein [Acidobacteriota bacterium]
MSNRFVFQGGSSGLWKVTRQSAYRGENLPVVERLDIIPGEAPPKQTAAKWALTGFTSNVRYATAAEVARLKAAQPALGRPEAICGALIPIKKSAAWWALAQDERRAIFEDTSHHTAIGMEYLPAIARRLHHSRDLNEPFDFLTWFEFAPQDKPAFDNLVAKLRGTKEWAYVEREVDIRVERSA